MAERYDFYVHDNRKITFNLTEPIMQEDSGVTDFVFHIPKVLNELEVSDWAWWLVFVNAKKEKYSIALTLSNDPESPLEKNVATYTVDYTMSIKAGSVQFALEAINAGTGGAIDNEWHTLTYETKVKETLQGNQAEYAETESDIISALLEEVRTKMNQIIGGATPTPVASVSQMTDTSKLYLLTTDGEWYYYNGTQFVSGGVYGAGVVDSVPTQGSTNAVSSGGVYEALDGLPKTVTPTETEADFYLSDEDGNVLLELTDGHIRTKHFDSSDVYTKTDTTFTKEGEPADSKAVGDALDSIEGDIQAVEESIPDVSGFADIKASQETAADLYICDSQGNVIGEFANGHFKTRYFDSSRSDQNAVLTVNNTAPDSSGNVNVRAELDPEDVQPAVSDYLNNHPVIVSGGGVVSVDDYGAVGDGITDDSLAIQNAVNSNYDVYFESNKTYYLASTVTINHDIKLHGGINTIIKTKTPTGGIVNDAFVVSGTLKKATALTTDYTTAGRTDNSGNCFTLTDMTDIAIGDVMVIKATDQYYSYARQYYYLGATLLIADIYDGHIYTSNSMPWNIINSANVTVEIYNAPTAIIENLHFVSDRDSRGNSKYCISLVKCKNTVVRNCSFTDMDNGLMISMCVNTLVEQCSVSHSKYDNSLSGDGYGICIASSSNTTIYKVMAICAQGCLDLGGTIPILNTFVKECELSSECRAIGIDMHENSYNIVVEDCTLGGLSLYGTAHVNRCRFIRNNRVGNDTGIIFRGSHDERWAKLRVENCVFDKYMTIQLSRPSPQSPIQPFDNIISRVDLINCDGGRIVYNPTVTAEILSNTIKRFAIINLKDCDSIYHTEGNIIESLAIYNSTFLTTAWINKYTGNLYYGGIWNLSVKADYPKKNQLFADIQKYGNSYLLPQGIEINFNSADANGLYIVCGKNIASNNPDDYSIGNVNGSIGGTLSRSTNNAFTNSLSTDADGNLIFTQPNNTATSAIYLKCMAYVRENSKVKMSCVLKNTNPTTSGATFRPMIAIVDCNTGLITYRSNGNEGTASVQGTKITHSRTATKHSVVLCYTYCNAPIANSETTFEDYMIEIMPYEFEHELVYEKYNGASIVGNGTLRSVDGLNHIMATPESFDAVFKVDYLEV